MVKVKIVFYALVSMGFQILLGKLTGQGQGGVGTLTFLILMELDPNYSFAYLLQHKDKKNKA